MVWTEPNPYKHTLLDLNPILIIQVKFESKEKRLELFLNKGFPRQ